MKKEIKVLVAVSGGPDSMALLGKMLRKRKYFPIVCHINYNFREESVKETELVEIFCKQYNIPFFFLNVDDEVLEKYKKINNKQAMARKIRYDFFLKIAEQEKINDIFIAHHKDDFIETAIMQEEKSSDYLFYGIKEKSNYKSLIIHRPLLKYWKDELIDYCTKYNIPFLIDKSNFDPKYERNKIRINLLNTPLKTKNKIYDQFIKINKGYYYQRKKVEKKYEDWKNQDYLLDFYLKNDDFTKRNLIYFFLIKNDIEVNKNKILSIMEFLEKKENSQKEFRLQEKTFLTKKNNKIILEVKNGN